MWPPFASDQVDYKIDPVNCVQDMHHHNSHRERFSPEQTSWDWAMKSKQRWPNQAREQNAVVVFSEFPIVPYTYRKIEKSSINAYLPAYIQYAYCHWTKHFTNGDLFQQKMARFERNVAVLKVLKEVSYIGLKL